MSGGEVFHEMMLRLGVKHVCESFLYSPSIIKLADLTSD